MKYLLVLLLVIPFSLAHLDAGEDKVIGDYIADFGYSPENPTDEESVTMSLVLVNKTTNQPIRPESTWVRISSGDDVVLTATLHPGINNVTFFSYRFISPDEYVIDVKFNGEEIVKTSFQLSIAKSSSPTLILLVISLIILIIAWRRRK